MLYNKINEDEVRVYNRKTGEVLFKCFHDPMDADEFEFVLDFLGAEYERFHNGTLVYNELGY